MNKQAFIASLGKKHPGPLQSCDLHLCGTAHIEFCLGLGIKTAEQVVLVSPQVSDFFKKIHQKLFSVPIKRHQNIGVKFLRVTWNQQHGDAIVMVFLVSSVVLEVLFSPIFLCALVIYLFLI